LTGGERNPKGKCTVNIHLLILDPSAEKYRKALQPKFPEVVIHAATQEEGIGAFIEKMHVLLTFRISDDLIKRATNLQWIQAMGTGVDRLMHLHSLRKEVLITSTRGLHGPQMSEMALLLMLSLSRNFPQIVRNQDQGIWERWPGEPLYQKKVGILGIGVIGKEIALKCKAFGMTVFGISRRKKDIDAIDYFYGPEDLLKVMREVDYFIIVVPYTPETRKMIGPQALSSMKPTAFLINLARGAVIDEDALIHALSSKTIAGAALDVFSQEPLPKEHPFWKMRNVIITPHVGGWVTNYAEQVLSIFEDNLQRFLKGERNNLVNLVERY
jgi:D-2-hydroxyacid dehydrogenase (NADP+)